MFYGLVVMLYYFDDERHHLPHVHVKYQNHEASFAIGDASLLAGNLPVAKMRLMQAWIEIHREDLMANWELASNGEKPFPVDPLR